MLAQVPVPVLVPVLVLVLVLAPGQATERALAPAMRRSLGQLLRTQAQTQPRSSSCRQKYANRAPQQCLRSSTRRWGSQRKVA